LVGPDGKTLYFNTVDTATSISCGAGCTSLWPPVLGTARPGSGLAGGSFGTTTRPGGGRQVTFHGHPLYEFKADHAGTAMGAGIVDAGGHWVVATPSGSTSAPSSAAGSSAGNPGGGYGYP